MTYKVLITIDHPKVKHQWWSDQVALPSFTAAQRYRKDVAAKWNDCGTAILAPDGRVLAFKESLLFQSKLEDEKNENS
jgi:hypothetical protein